LTIIRSSIPHHEKNRVPLISNSLWSGGVVLVHLAAAKKVVVHHASGKQEKYDCQEHDEQEFCKPKPG
jgi:hypothetical protein